MPTTTTAQTAVESLIYSFVRVCDTQALSLTELDRLQRAITQVLHHDTVTDPTSLIRLSAHLDDQRVIRRQPFDHISDRPIFNDVEVPF